MSQLDYGLNQTVLLPGQRADNEEVCKSVDVGIFRRHVLETAGQLGRKELRPARSEMILLLLLETHNQQPRRKPDENHQQVRRPLRLEPVNEILVDLALGEVRLVNLF